MAEILSLDRPNGALQLLERLDKRRMGGKYDFTIIVEGRKIFAEQNVLSSGSDYFKAMLSYDTKEKQNGVVEISDADFESVNTCIDCIYGREITVSPERFSKLMFAAHMLQLRALSDALEEKMTTKLEVKTFFTIRNIAITFSCAELEEKCRKFAEQNFERITENNGFLEIDRSMLISLLTSHDVQVDEERKLEVIVKWVKADHKRESHLLELLKCIDFSRISFDAGQSYIRDEPVIYNNNECLRFFSLSFMKAVTSPAKNYCDVAKRKGVVLFDGGSENLLFFNPADCKIEKLSFKKPDFYAYRVVLLDGCIYAFSEVRTVHQLVLSDEGTSWIKRANLVNCFSGNPAVASSGSIYVINNFSSSMDQYAPSRNEWVEIKYTDGPEFSAHYLGSRQSIYSFGGWAKGTNSKEVKKFDLSTSRWTCLSPTIKSKECISATESENLIYVAGGSVKNKYMTSLESYNTLVDQWTMISRKNFGRTGFQLHAVDGCLYAVGGKYLRGSSDTIEKYDHETTEWKVVVMDVLLITNSLTVGAIS